MTCHSCSKSLPDESKFCMFCGALLDADAAVTMPFGGENRIVSCMFADIAGFTNMSMHLKPEELVNRMNLFFKIVSEAVSDWGGVINKFIGDCALVVFGAPHAHENDPARAVYAAIRIQEKLDETSLKATIGINTGRVFFGIVGNSLRSQIDVYGAAINIAQRLQGIAGPGEIVIGESTRNALGESRSFEAMPNLQLKGLDKPVTAYKLILRSAPRNQQHRAIVPSGRSLIGRSCETDLFITKFNSPGNSIIRGETGIGKTTLAHEFGRIAANAGKELFVIRAETLNENLGYGIIRELIGELLTGNKEFDTCLMWEDRLNDLLPEESRLFVPVIRRLRGGSCESEPSAEYDNQSSDFKMMLGLLVRQLLITMNSRSPLFIIFEDLHWCDQPSLQMLIPVLLSYEETGIHTVCTWRIPFNSEELDLLAKTNTDEVSVYDLCPFGISEISNYIAEYFGVNGIDSEIALQILKKTEGNPLFIRELMKTAFEKSDDRLASLKDLSNIPESIQSLMISRYDSLSEKEKSVLRTASVLGAGFSLNDISACISNPLPELYSLIEKEILVRDGAFDEGPYRFMHTSMRESVNATLLVSHRRDLNMKILEYFESSYDTISDLRIEELARLSIDIEDNVRIWKYSRTAGDRAFELSALNEAAHHFRNAIGAAKKIADNASDIMLKLSNVELGLFHADQTIAILDEWAREYKGSQNEERFLQSLLLRCRALYLKLIDDASYLEKTSTVLDQAYDLAVRIQSVEGQLRATKIRLDLCDFTPELAAKRSGLNRTLLELIPLIENAELKIDARILLLRISPPNLDEMLTLVADTEKMNDPVKLIELYYLTGWANLGFYPLHHAVEILNKAIVQCKRIMVKPYMYPTACAIAHSYMGNFEEAEKMLPLEVTGEGNAFTTCFQLWGYALLDYSRDRWLDAAKKFEQVIAQAKILERSWLRFWAIEMASKSYAKAGQTEGLSARISSWESSEKKRIAQSLLEGMLADNDAVNFFADLEQAILDKTGWSKLYMCDILDTACRGCIQFGEFEKARTYANKAIDLCSYLEFNTGRRRFDRYIQQIEQSLSK